MDLTTTVAPVYVAPVYVATTDVPCRVCSGPTIPPTPGRPEEQGHYCEACATETGDATGGPALTEL